MINPILPYAIRGAIWYQGESILGNPGIPGYGHVMASLVTTWRQLWGEGNFPFYEVQLGPLKNNSNNPRVFQHRAESYALAGSYKAAFDDAGQAIKLDPEFIPAFRIRQRLESQSLI